jgi:hypothetical protein
MTSASSFTIIERAIESTGVRLVTSSYDEPPVLVNVRPVPLIEEPAELGHRS